MHVKSDATSRLGNHCTLLQSVVNALNAIILHGHEEAAAELRVRGARIEEGGRCVNEPPLTHQIVRIHSSINIFLVNAHRNAHEHVLRALDQLAIDAQQVGPLQSLESEVVVVKITIVDDLRIKTLSVARNDVVDVVGDES